MNPAPFEGTWLDASQTISLHELSQVCGMSLTELDELVEYGALSPWHVALQTLVFKAECVVPLRTVSQLRRDFDLDLFAVALVLDYVHRVHLLEHQVQALQAQLPARHHFPPIDAPVQA